MTPFCAHCGGSTEPNIDMSGGRLIYPCSCGFTAAGRERIERLEKELSAKRDKCRWYDELIAVIYEGEPDGMNERPDPRQLIKMWRGENLN